MANKAAGTKVKAVSSGVLAKSALLTGASGTGNSKMLTVPVLDSAPRSSVTAKVTGPGLPFKLALGWNWRFAACSGVNTAPAPTGAPLTNKVPPVGTEIMRTLTTEPSLSLPIKEMGKVLSSSPVTLAELAVGGVFGVVMAPPAALPAIWLVGTPDSLPLVPSLTRPTRSPSPKLEPSAPPVRPAAVAASAWFCSNAEITRSVSLASTRCATDGAAASPSWVRRTIPSWVVRITSPLRTTSPILSTRITPSLPRIRALPPHKPVTIPCCV